MTSAVLLFWYFPTPFFSLINMQKYEWTHHFKLSVPLLSLNFGRRLINIPMKHNTFKKKTLRMLIQNRQSICLQFSLKYKNIVLGCSLVNAKLEMRWGIACLIWLNLFLMLLYINSVCQLMHFLLHAQCTQASLSRSSGHFYLSPCDFMKMVAVHELQVLRKKFYGDWISLTSVREKNY